ncbi:mitotic spindle assembly checkpoint protein MAD1-like [Periplaneta americana]|uniref:mitotic spindle assembly checkpoint protein MAD1-like n=2 Tax=Periplaneta americana TaxID=6978 RepID=UPI0037E93538
MSNSNTDDPTCVIKMLDEFRSCNPQRLPNLTNFETKELIPTRLQFDDSTYGSKKRKCSDSPLSISVEQDSQDTSDMSILSSPWNTRRMKADLAESKAQNIILEERVKKLHALRKELELVFENEKTSLLKQQARDRETIKALEDRVNTLRKRESEAKEELSQYKQQNESSKFNLEKKIFFLEKENARLEDQLKQVELLLHKKSTGGERRISELEAELKLSMEEVALFKNHVKSLGEKATEVASLKHTLELVELQLNEASQRIKELELELEKGKEARELLDKQQQNLTRLPSLEREVTSLREENRNLRDAVHNKLILEEEVMDLRSRQAGYEEREQQLTQLQATQGQLENLLEQWHRLARDHCVGAPPEKAISGPELLRIRIETLQQKELILTADKGQLDSQLKAAQNGKSRTEMELEKATKQIEKLQGVQEQQSNLIKRLQKKLLLVSRERDSYRSQLDLYEKELTVTSTSALLTSQQQQQKSRIEALEKTVEGYRELAEKLESDLEKASKGSGGLQTTERIMKLEEERNMLQKEKEELLKRRDELEIELEQRALKGDFNPLKTRVLHFRMNPAAKAEAEQQDEVAQLKQECERLQERVRVLEGGQTLDVTEAVNFRLATSSSQEVKELREQIKSYDTKLQRLKEAFKSTSQEYREVCYILLGYRIDRIKPNLYRLSSMYADSPDDFLMFKLVNGSPELLETPYSLTLEEFINLHLKHQHSMPVFLSAITLDLFQRQTVCSSGDPITLE